MADTSSSRIPDTTMDAELVANLEREYAALVQSRPTIGDEPWESDTRRYNEARAALLSRLEAVTRERNNWKEASDEGCEVIIDLRSRLEARERELAEWKRIAMLGGEVETRLTKELAEAEKAAHRASQEVADWENREAKICPEYFSFEEVIESLRSQNAEMMRVIEAAKRLERLVAGKWEKMSLPLDILGAALALSEALYPQPTDTAPASATTPENKND